eukprot:Pgem_evm1s6193
MTKVQKMQQHPQKVDDKEHYDFCLVESCSESEFSDFDSINLEEEDMFVVIDIADERGGIEKEKTPSHQNEVKQLNKDSEKYSEEPNSNKANDKSLMINQKSDSEKYILSDTCQIEDKSSKENKKNKKSVRISKTITILPNDDLEVCDENKNQKDKVGKEKDLNVDEEKTLELKIRREVENELMNRKGPTNKEYFLQKKVEEIFLLKKQIQRDQQYVLEKLESIKKT